MTVTLTFTDTPNGRCDLNLETSEPFHHAKPPMSVMLALTAISEVEKECECETKTFLVREVES